MSTNGQKKRMDREMDGYHTKIRTQYVKFGLNTIPLLKSAWPISLEACPERNRQINVSRCLIRV